MVSAVLLSQSAIAQTTIEIDANGNGAIVEASLGPGLLGGAIPALSFGQPPSPGLVIRAQQPVLCAGVGQQGSNPLKRVVLDLNGYFEPVLLAESAVERDLGLMFYGRGAFLRATEPVRFATSAYVPGPNGLVFDLAGLSAYCLLAPTVDTPPAATACTTTESEEDAIFADGLQPQTQGNLQLTATSAANGVNVDYEYVLRAVGGPVYKVDLREQFPYFLIGSTELPTFASSLALQQNWSCEASAGGICDSRGRVIDGAGYIHLEGGSLASGACLKVSSSRFLRTDGLELANPFSGRLHTGAIYTTAPTAQGPAQRTHTALRHLFAQ